MENTKNEASGTKLACTSCGAFLIYKPGTQHLSCEYCGFENEIPVLEEEIKELNYSAYLNDKNSIPTTPEELIKCESCKAISMISSNLSSAFCPYCSTPLIIENVYRENIIQPKALLPFKLDQQLAKKEFDQWIKKLTFAPNNLKKSLNLENLKGIYIPYWTYDIRTITRYTGERGEYYYTTENYTTTENGKEVSRTRQVRHTRWYNVSGIVRAAFDDILITATRSLPENYLQNLEPWDVENLVPFDKSYLSGFITEKYQIGLKEGCEIAQKTTVDQIAPLIVKDIGGDEQRVSSTETTYYEVTFKHLLFPVYVSVYKYKDKVYQFLINGRTGEVQGERPFSAVKVFFFYFTILVIIVLVVMFFKNQHQ